MLRFNPGGRGEEISDERGSKGGCVFCGADAGRVFGGDAGECDRYFVRYRGGRDGGGAGDAGAAWAGAGAGRDHAAVGFGPDGERDGD